MCDAKYHSPISPRLKCFYMCDIPSGYQAEHIIYSLEYNEKKCLTFIADYKQ